MPYLFNGAIQFSPYLGLFAIFKDICHRFCHIVWALAFLAAVAFFGVC